MMALFSRLRRTVALVVCPELRAADADRVASNPELAEVPAYAQIIGAMRPRPEGLFDLNTAREERRKRRSKGNPIPAMTWRDIPRICIPGWLISRAIAKTARLPGLVGPAMYQRLERLDERLSDRTFLARHAAPLQSTVRWLLKEPSSARPAILEQTSVAACGSPTPDPLLWSAQGSCRSEGTSL